MSTPAYYRDEALHCRELAAKSRDADAIKRWLLMAVEYDRLADSMAAATQVARGAPPQREIPRQQSEAEPGKNQA